MSASSHRVARRRRTAAALAVVLVAVAAGGAVWASSGDDSPSTSGTTVASPQASEPAPEPRAAWLPTDDELAAARDTADALTLEELAGQLIVARHFDAESSLALVRDQHFAGVMVTGNQILDVTTDDPLVDVKGFNDELRALGEERGVPVMVPIDQEGGLVARLADPLTTFPTFMSAGAAIAGSADSADVVTAAARASGAELREAGYNAVFAPVADVTVGSADPVIGSRSPGSDPAVVGAAVSAAVTGYGEAGMLAGAKHFPGHNVDVDSHEELPEVDSDRERLRTHDLAPFVEAIDGDVPMIMTGHLDVRFIDPGVPASLSRPVITDGLRGSLGFDGLVVSDSLGMGAVMQQYPGGRPAVEAIKAGSDIALMPADNLEAYDAVLEALESGEIPEEQARQSATRTIASLRHVEAMPALPGEAGSHVAEAEALSAAAVTTVAGRCDADPLDSVALAGAGPSVEAFRRAAEEVGLGTGAGPTLAFTGYGGSGAYGDIVVSTDAPYSLARSTAPTMLALYGGGEPAMLALARMLKAGTDAPGRLPVELEGVAAEPC